MTEEAYRAIKSGILRNKCPGAFQILEDGLARSLEMSRTPVRKALLRLDIEGLIELIPRHGMRVRPLSLDIPEAYQTLGFMETPAAEMIAASTPNKRQVALLKSHVDAISAALLADDILEWAEAGERFHRALADLSGNSRLACWPIRYSTRRSAFADSRCGCLRSHPISCPLTVVGRDAGFGRNPGIHQV